MFAWWFIFATTRRSIPGSLPEEAALIAAEREPEVPATPKGALAGAVAAPSSSGRSGWTPFLILIQSFYTSWLPTYLVQARQFLPEIYGHLCLAALGGAVLHGVSSPEGWRTGCCGPRVRCGRRGCRPRSPDSWLAPHGLILAAETANVRADDGVPVHLVGRHRADTGFHLVVVRTWEARRRAW